MSGFDIVSTVTIAEQFAEVVFTTIKLVNSVINQIQDAPDQIQQQVGRLESLSSLAKQIQNTKTLQVEEINKILIRCESRAQTIQDLLRKTSFESHDSIRKKTWRAIFSLKEEENIWKLFDLLDQEHNSLNTHINLHILAVAEDMQVGYHSIDTKLNTIAQAADSSPDSLKCLQALFITDPAMDRAKLITSKGELVPGTCKWITQKEEFTEWRTSDGGLLWISGGPGMGKTMLSIYLTEYLSSCFHSHDEEQSHYSTYFFCDAKDSTRNNAIALLRGLLFQLLEQKKEFIQHILPTYQIQKDQLFEQKSFEALWKYFLKMVDDLRNSQVTCIIDGLDECEPKSLEPLLTKLSKITSTSPRLRMIILSREYPQSLGDWLRKFPRIRLDPDAKTEVGDGLDLYISTRVAELSERKQYPDDLANDVKKILRDNSAGTYLWVSFVVKDLQEIGRSEVKDSLEQLPQGLDALYERILNQIKPVYQDLTLDILRWCTLAVRQLKLDELVAVLNIQPTGSLDKKTVLREKLAACGHFLNIADDDTVTLVHQSAYDFLTTPISDSESIPWFSLCRVEAEHSKLASRCIAYFQDAYFNKRDAKRKRVIAEKMPFFSYAALKWFDHFNRSGQQGVKVLDECPEFFSSKSKVLKAWIQGYYGYYRFGMLEHVATELGLTALMQRIVKEQGTWLYLKDKFAKSDPLLALAAENGHLPIVELLMSNKMNINARDKWGYAPLHRAVEGGQLPIFEALMKKKARINVKNGYGQTPLQIAAQRGHLPIVEMLLKNNADIHSTDELGQTPLHDAVAGGHLPIFEALMNKRAQINVKNGYGQTPLQIAAQRGHLPIVEMLLKNNADISNTDLLGRTPLHDAAAGGHLPIVGMLIKNNADIHSTDRRGQTPLHGAAAGGYLPIVEMLIENGAHADSIQWKERPLYAAAQNGHYKTAEYLLTCGASVNSEGPESSPLAGAIYYGKPAVVKLLLERESDDRIHDRGGLSPVGRALKWSPTTLITCLEVWAQRVGTVPAQFRDRIDFGETTALHLACRAGDLPAMRLLLDPKWSLDLNWRDEDGNTPLHMAAMVGRKEAVDLLLTQSSVEPKLANKWDLSPLDMALLYHKTAIVRRLVEECNISLPESDENCRWSSIHLVTLRRDWVGWERESVEILQVLIEELGVDPQGRTPNAKFPDDKWHTHHYFEPYHSLMESIKHPDFCHETPLSLAIRLGRTPTVKYLLARCNIDLNTPCRGCDGASPLHVAAQNLYADIVELLISKKANANCLDNYQRTPLHSMASGVISLPEAWQEKSIAKGNIIIHKLLAAGAQTSTIDIDGRTPRDLFASGKRFRSTREIMGMESIFDRSFRITNDLLYRFTHSNGSNSDVELFDSDDDLSV